MPSGPISEKILAGERLSREDAIGLFQSDDIFTLGELAWQASRKRHGKKAFYVRNIHVNPTNICVNRCRFCAFSRSEGEPGAYEMSSEDIIRRIASAMPVEEVHIVGGLHPKWPFGHYQRFLRSIRKRFPRIHIKAFTATEIDYFSRISGMSLSDVLSALRESGLDAMPGGGAEIFDPSVRQRLCPEKLSADGWIRVMEKAHSLGIKTNATMLYGHVETYANRVDHLLKLRELQDRTGGFQAFIPLSYHSGNTEMGGGSGSGLDDLKTVAVSRLVLDNFPHVKAYWVMLGEKVSQLALRFGADDLDGTVIEEKITYATDTQGKARRGITEAELRTMIKKAGLSPVRRDAFYRAVR